MMQQIVASKKRSAIRKRSRKRWLFYSVAIAFPLAQFALFYIGVNLNSIVLAFQSYSYETGSYDFAGLTNFVAVADAFRTTAYLWGAVRRSLLLYVVTLCVGVTLAVLFSYYIYKKFRGSELFKVFLFLPSIISGVVLVIMFNYFVDRAVPSIIEVFTGTQPEGLLSNEKTAFGTVLFYTIWAGFGTQILMYSGAMNGISPSVVESAQLDGITPVREFFRITLPLVWPTFTTFVVVGVAGIFTNQMNLYSFYGASAEFDMYTIGYYLYRAMKVKQTTFADYPFYSAFGLLFTIVSVPVTLVVKYLLEKFGPSDE